MHYITALKERNQERKDSTFNHHIEMALDAITYHTWPLLKHVPCLNLFLRTSCNIHAATRRGVKQQSEDLTPDDTITWVLVETALEDGEEVEENPYSERNSCTSEVWNRPESPGSLI